MPFAEIIETFPPKLRAPVSRLVDALMSELALRRSDFEELKGTVHELAEAQKRTEQHLEELAEAQKRTEQRLEELAEAQNRTEQRLEELAEAQKELAEAQKRTEQRLEELAEAQNRTEQRLEQLAEAQKELAEAQKHTEQRLEELAEAQNRTEQRLEELAEAQKELAEAQKHTEQRLEELAEAQKELAEAQKRTDQHVEGLGRTQHEFARTFHMQLGGIGARWGLQTEESFRQGMRTILADVGLRTERFVQRDESGEVFGAPDQVELDLVIQDGKVIVVEIKSSVDKGDVYLFQRKVDFFSRTEGRRADRKLMVTPYADNPARQTALRLGIEVCTDVNTL